MFNSIFYKQNLGARMGRQTPFQKVSSMSDETLGVEKTRPDLKKLDIVEKVLETLVF